MSTKAKSVAAPKSGNKSDKPVASADSNAVVKTPPSTPNNQVMVPAAPKKGSFGKVLLLTEEQRRERRNLYLSASLAIDSQDNDLKDRKQLGTVIKIPAVITGATKEAKVIKAVVPDLLTFGPLVGGAEVLVDDLGRGYIEVVFDVRDREDRASDEAKGVKPEDYVVRPASEVRDTLDPNKEIGRVSVRITSFESIKLINKAQANYLNIGSFALLNVEPRAWRGDDKKRFAINAMINLNSVGSHHQMPIAACVEWLYAAAAWTQHFETKVAKYKKSMLDYIREHHAEPDQATKNALTYRTDNEMLIMLGFNHGDYMDQHLDMDAGVSFIDNTKRVDTNYKNFDTDTNKFKLCYRTELLVSQWEAIDGAPPGYPSHDPSRVMRFQLSIPIWAEIIERLAINSFDLWREIAPVNMPYFKAAVFGRENAKNTFENALTCNRLACLANPDDINTPVLPSEPVDEVPEGEEGEKDTAMAQANRLSFVMSVQADAVLFDPVVNLQYLGIPVTADDVKRHLFGGKTMPVYPADARGDALDPTRPFINLSELKCDVKRVLDNPAFEYRVLSNYRGVEGEFTQDMFGSLSVKDGELVLGYLAGVLAKRGTLSRDDYLKTKRAAVGPDHILRKYNFQLDGTKPTFVVFAINKETIKASEQAFNEFITTIEGATPELFRSMQTNVNTLPLLQNATLQIEEVKEPTAANPSVKRKADEEPTSASAPAPKKAKGLDGEAIVKTSLHDLNDPMATEENLAPNDDAEAEKNEGSEGDGEEGEEDNLIIPADDDDDANDGKDA